jgi:hypothetical protein
MVFLRRSDCPLTSIGGFHEMLGGQLYTYCSFIHCGSEKISLNCMYLSSHTTGSPPRVLLKLCIRITYEIYSSVLKPAICGLCAG